MKLSECNKGRIVKTKSLKGTSSIDGFIYGHITGLSENSVGEVIIKVLWHNDDEYTIHPENLLKVED